MTMNDSIYTALWVCVWFGAIGAVVGIGGMARVYWRAYKRDRTSHIPLETWEAFADSLDEPQRSQVRATVARSYFPIGLVVALSNWHIEKTRTERARRDEARRRLGGIRARRLRRQGETAGVYVVKSHDRYKIGCSQADVRDRIYTLQTASAYPLETVFIIYTTEPRLLEKYLHGQFTARRIVREWFDLHDADLHYLDRLSRNPAAVTSLVSKLASAAKTA